MKKLIATLLMAVMAASTSFAQSTWNSTTSSDWATPGNWSPADPLDYPGVGTLVGTNVVISTDQPLANTFLLSGTTVIGSLDFNAGSGITFNSDGSPGTSLQVDGGMTISSSGTSPQFALPVIVGGNSTFTGGSGALIFNSLLSVGTNTLTTSGAINLSSLGSLSLGIGDSVLDPYGNIAGAINFSAGASVQITILGGYTGVDGDVFTFGSAFTGATLAALPDLDPGLSWDSSNFITAGTLTVVPEPSTWALAAGSLLLLTALGHRRFSKREI